MATNNDLQCYDSSYANPFYFMGKNRRLGRTNTEIRIYIGVLREELERLEKTTPEGKEALELLLKEIQEVSKKARSTVKKIVKPITAEELSELSHEDLEVIDRELQRRTMRARGYTEAQILELEEADRQLLLKGVREQVNFQITDNQDPEAPMSQNME